MIYHEATVNNAKAGSCGSSQKGERMIYPKIKIGETIKVKFRERAGEREGYEEREEEFKIEKRYPHFFLCRGKKYPHTKKTISLNDLITMGLAHQEPELEALRRI